jgi:hypothetical protein
VLHTKTLPGNPYDGHTLKTLIEDTEKLTGCKIERAYVDKGYRGHETKNLVLSENFIRLGIGCPASAPVRQI